MQIQDVELTKINLDSGHELSNTFYRVCSFCNKVVRVNPYNFKSCLKIGGNKFFCPFCLRNKHHHRSSRNILIMSYRAIVGYYYLRFYQSNPHKMWLSQIESMLHIHEQMGLQSPVMTYDPSTFLWYVDFNQIGSGSRHAPFNEVSQTLDMVLDVFNLTHNLSSKADAEVRAKFSSAVESFHEKRKRPVSRRMLIPTLSGVITREDASFFDQTREFTKNNLIA